MKSDSRDAFWLVCNRPVDPLSSSLHPPGVNEQREEATFIAAAAERDLLPNLLSNLLSNQKSSVQIIIMREVCLLLLICGENTDPDLLVGQVFFFLVGLRQKDLERGADKPVIRNGYSAATV